MTETPESLTAQFEALHAERERTWEPDKLRQNIEQRQFLVANFNADAVVKPGDRVQPFELFDSEGGITILDDLVANGPALLIFFRFAGCPACNLALPYYERQLWPALAAAGIRLVAVSPHLPEKGLGEIRTRHALTYQVAADRDNRLGRQFGITFEPADSPTIPAGDDSWIGALTGTGTWELPQPAAVLIDRDCRPLRRRQHRLAGPHRSHHNSESNRTSAIGGCSMTFGLTDLLPVRPLRVLQQPSQFAPPENLAP